MKKIIIYKCQDCPNIEDWFSYTVCREPNGNKIILDISIIPEWCPLPDDV